VLEALYRALFSCADRPKYEPFAPALHAACEKIDEYYDKTTESPTCIMSMSTEFCPYPSPITNILLVLNPKEKMSYFKKNWPFDLHEDILKCVEKEVHRSLFCLDAKFLTARCSVLLVQREMATIERCFYDKGICTLEKGQGDLCSASRT
jgi:hypothetical protein